MGQIANTHYKLTTDYIDVSKYAGHTINVSYTFSGAFYDSNKETGYCQADKSHRPIVDDTNDYNPKTKPKWCPIKLLK